MIEIVDWAKHYENNRTRELKHMAWVPMPNRHDGFGYNTIIKDHPNGLSHFGAWVVLIEVASRCDPRGTLVRYSAGTPIPYDEEGLERMTGVSISQWKEALPRLVNVGWITGYAIPQEGATIPHKRAARPHPSAIELNGTELNRTEGNGTIAAIAAASIELYHSVEKAFLSKNDDKFTDFAKEGSAIKGVIKKATARSPGLEHDLLKGMIHQLWKLRCSDDKFWKGQPFLPSTLNSSGIWDRVLETMRSTEKMADPVAMAVAKGEIK